MTDQVALINVRAAWRRVLLIVPVVLALGGAWYGVRWAAGSTLAETAQDFETAEAAGRLAPRDPQSHLRAARLRRASFLPEELPRALAEYERAAALAPNDYLVWLEVGQARSAAGDEEGALSALRRSAELAPHYAQPRWFLGNTLLRAGRTEEAFAELRLAADADPTLRPQVFNLAWHLYRADMARVLDAVGRTPVARAQLVGVLTGRGNLNEALSVWASLGGEEKRASRVEGERLARALYAGGQYRRAAQVLAEAGAVVPRPGELLNGGFESDISQAGRDLFGWQVTGQPAGVQVAVDASRAGAGSRSLRFVFNSSAQAELGQISQLFTIDSGARYRLSYLVRTEDVRTAATAAVQVTDPGGAVLATSPPAPTGSSEWRRETLEFAAGPGVEGAIVRIVRVGCPDPVCPIFGRIWYDDFNLERAAGRAGNAR